MSLSIVCVVSLLNSKKNDVLVFSIERNHPLFAKSCLLMGANPNAKGELDIPVLFMAIAKRDEMNLVFTQMLLDFGANPNFLTSNKNTPLIAAIKASPALAIGCLLKKGANPNSRNSLGETPLLISALRGEIPVVEELIKYGAFDLGNAREGSALDLARNLGFSEIKSRLEKIKGTDTAILGSEE
jgi:ankyrin repeat protein